jgi:hypothetical protein
MTLGHFIELWWVSCTSKAELEVVRLGMEMASSVDVGDGVSVASAAYMEARMSMSVPGNSFEHLVGVTTATSLATASMARAAAAAMLVLVTVTLVIANERLATMFSKCIGGTDSSLLKLQ